MSGNSQFRDEIVIHVTKLHKGIQEIEVSAFMVKYVGLMLTCVKYQKENVWICKCVVILFVVCLPISIYLPLNNWNWWVCCQQKEKHSMLISLWLSKMNEQKKNHRMSSPMIDWGTEVSQSTNNVIRWLKLNRNVVIYWVLVEGMVGFDFVFFCWKKRCDKSAVKRREQPWQRR